MQIIVSDTGVGIGVEHRARIFDEFYQLRNPERDRNKGTGLGLAISKRLVDAMGGTIDVDSTSEKGSTFIVTLPASAVVSKREAVAGLESGIGMSVTTDRPPRPKVEKRCTKCELTKPLACFFSYIDKRPRKRLADQKLRSDHRDLTHAPPCGGACP